MTKDYILASLSDVTAHEPSVGPCRAFHRGSVSNRFQIDPGDRATGHRGAPPPALSYGHRGIKFWNLRRNLLKNGSR
jgi:hypothetical protein